MKKIIKQLILVYFIIVIAKAILTYFVPAPSAFSDGYIYSKLARSIFFGFEYTLHNLVHNHYHPIYPLILSPAYLFGKMAVVYPVMKVINSITSSLIIFPAFLLAKEFLSSKKAFYITILIALIPPSFIFSSYLLAENLFYPIFLLTFYFIYKSFTSPKLYWALLAGLGIGLSYLTKIHGLVLIPAFATVVIYKFFKREKLKFSYVFLTALLSTSIIALWMFRSYLLQGNLVGEVHTSEASTLLELNKFFLKFIIQFILYTGLLILSSGVFFPMLISRKIFNKPTLIFSLLSLSTILFTLLINSNHNIQLSSLTVSYEVPENTLPWLAGRLIGRYIDFLIPLVMILGAICIKEKISLKKTIAFSGILIFSSQLILTRLLPINHVSTAYIGLFDIVSEFFITFPTNMIILAIILAIIPFIFYKLKLDFNKAIAIFSIFFILLNLLNFSMIYYNSNTFWHKGDQMQLGIWLDSYDPEPSKILFDERDCTTKIEKTKPSICEPSKSATIIGFWLNDDITIGPPNNLENFDFLISRHEMPLKLIKASNDNIYIYSLEEN